MSKHYLYYEGERQLIEARFAELPRGLVLVYQQN
jgi:hypothetical protein